MREFRPPMLPSTARPALAVVLGVLMAIVMVPLVLVAVGSKRIGYTLSQGTLLVDSGSWLDGSRTIPLGVLHEKKPVTLRHAHRTRGTALPGYCAGLYSYEDVGAVWQATNCSPEAVLLTTNDGERPVLVTPPDRDAFLYALDVGTPFHIELAPGDTRVLRVVVGLVLVSVLIISALAIATLVLGPARMVYRVGSGRLEVKTIFGHRQWPASSLRAHTHVAKLQLRLAGTAVRGYYTGYFIADGRRTRVYATDPSAGVLIEGPARVFLSPDDRAGFLEALRAEGAAIA